jgi:hypothetical protein
MSSQGGFGTYLACVTRSGTGQGSCKKDRFKTKERKKERKKEKRQTEIEAIK